MSITYFDPEHIEKLAEIFSEAKRIMGNCDTAALDTVAHRILRLAADGLPPAEILREVAPKKEAERRDVKRRSRPGNKVIHLYTQAERARKFATSCGSQLVADLWGVHALLCEESADHRLQRQKHKSSSS